MYEVSFEIFFFECLPVVSTLLTGIRLVDFGVFAHANAGDPVLCLFPATGIRAVRRIRAASTATSSGPVYLRTFPTHAFLSGVSTREHVSSRAGVLYWRSFGSVGRRTDHIRRRRIPAAAH